MYGCDVTYNERTYSTSYGIMINGVLNLFIILVAYSIVTIKLIQEQRAARFTTHSPIQNMFIKHIKMLITLSIFFAVCTLPVSILGWGMFEFTMEPDSKKTVQALISCLYWCMYGEFLYFPAYLYI
jgi:hypothetical protein